MKDRLSVPQQEAFRMCTFRQQRVLELSWVCLFSAHPCLSFCCVRGCKPCGFPGRAIARRTFPQISDIRENENVECALNNANPPITPVGELPRITLQITALSLHKLHAEKQANAVSTPISLRFFMKHRCHRYGRAFSV